MCVCVCVYLRIYNEWQATYVRSLINGWGFDPILWNCVGSRSYEFKKNLDKTTETELICHTPLACARFLMAGVFCKYTRVVIYIYICVCIYMCVCMCMYIYVYILRMHGDVRATAPYWQCVAVWCSVLQCDAAWCSVMQYDAVWCITVGWSMGWLRSVGSIKL